MPWPDGALGSDTDTIPAGGMETDFDFRLLDHLQLWLQPQLLFPSRVFPV